MAVVSSKRQSKSRGLGMIVLLFLRRLRHSLVLREKEVWSVGQAVIARSHATDTQHGSARYMATLACLLAACCLLGETRPCGEWSAVARQVKKDSATAELKCSSQRVDSTSVKLHPQNRGERGIYHCTLHTVVCCLCGVDARLCILAQCYMHSSLSFSLPQPHHTPGHRDANLVCRTGPRHRTRSHVSLISSPPQGCRLSVSLTGTEYSSHVRVLLPDTPTVHLPTSRPLCPVGSAYSTARRTHRLDTNGPQSNNFILMLASPCLIQQA